MKTIDMKNVKILSYADLDVYKRAYAACILIMKEVIPCLPESEKYDLKDQLSRSCKSIPRLIAEGFAKKYQKAGFQKYLVDGIGESDETQVSLCQCRDIYGYLMPLEIVNHLIGEYDIISRKLFKLKEKWSAFTGPKSIIK